MSSKTTSVNRDKEYNTIITQIEFLVVIIVTRMMKRMMKMNSYSVSKTVPAPKDKYSRTKFAIIADLVVFDHTKENLRNLTDNINDIDFVVLAGDISYANRDYRVWDNFFGMMDEMNFLPKKIKGSMFIRYDILRSCYDILYAHLYFLL
jgi:hypothetical protein